MERDFYDHARHANPLAKFMVKEYFGGVTEILRPLKISTALDVGSGKGEVTNYIGKLNGFRPIGLDSDYHKVSFFQQNCPDLQIMQADGTILPFKDNSFDLVIATEILEHQEAPEKLVQELLRVSKNYSFFSVPNEPYWRLENLMRGRYIQNLGSCPGHVQHWSTRAFEKFLSEFFENVRVRPVNIWNLALCKKVAK